MAEFPKHHSVLINGRQPKIGKPLLSECAIAINEAMCATSPALKARQSLFFRTMSFADFEEIKKAERADRPQDQLVIFNRLLSAGVPEEVL